MMELRMVEEQMGMEEDDGALLARYRAGASWVLDALYRKYSRPLYLYAFSLTRDPSRAEDVVQQTFLKLMDQDPGDVRDSVKALLYTIARNLVRDEVRRTQRVRAIFPRLEPASGAASPAEEDYEALSRALDQLPEDQRETLILKIHADMTFEGVAQLQSVPVATVKSRYRYALQRLLEILTEVDS